MSRTEEVFAQQEIFNREILPRLLPASLGKFALVHAGTLVGLFDTSDAAYDAAIARFGLDAVFCIALVEPVQAGPISVAWDFALL